MSIFDDIDEYINFYLNSLGMNLWEKKLFARNFTLAFIGYGLKNKMKL